MTPLADRAIEASAPMPVGASGRPETIIEWLEAQAMRFPQRAVFFERAHARSQNWEGSTFADFLTRVRHYASGLAALGLCKGDVVAITLPTCFEWECVEKAVLALGGAVVGVEGHATAAYQRHLVATVRPQALVVESLEQIRNYSSELLADVKFAIATEQCTPARVNGITVHPWTALSTHQSSSRPPAFPNADDDAAIVFTSGTTGNAKGVAFSHRQLLGAVRAIIERIDSLTPQDRTLCWLPMGNLLQRMINLCAMERGMEIYFHADARTIMESIRSARPTVFIGVPKIYQGIYQAFRDRLRRLPLGIGSRVLARLDALSPEIVPAGGPRHRSLVAHIAGMALRSALGGQMKLMVSGSAPCPVQIVHFFHHLGIPLLEAYGVSENATPIALNAPHAWRIGSVGRPLATNEVRISDEGEVLVRGPGVCSAYLGTTHGNASWDNEGFYHTGDDGYIDVDGYLWLSGRQADVAKLTSGRRVNLADVERDLWAQDNVDQAIAFAHGWDYVTCALVLTPPSHGSTTPEQRLARILEGVGRAQAEAPRYVRLRGVLLMSTPFSMDNDELTQNLKLRRTAIEEHHADQLAELHEQIKAASAAGNDAIVWLHA